MLIAKHTVFIEKHHEEGPEQQDIDRILRRLYPEAVFKYNKGIDGDGWVEVEVIEAGISGETPPSTRIAIHINTRKNDIEVVVAEELQ